MHIRLKSLKTNKREFSLNALIKLMTAKTKLKEK